MILPGEQATIDSATDFLRNRVKDIPQLAIVLGSGLGFFAEQLLVEKTVETASIPHYPQPTIAGHGGKLVFGKVDDIRLLAIQGRVHLYEGRSVAEVTFYVRLLANLGVKTLILTNAAGSVSESVRPGAFVLLTDYISLTQIPILPGNAPINAPFSSRLIQLAQAVAQENHIELHTGIYAWTLGPSYETPAEIQAIRKLGAHVVGMSTVPEALVAANLGMEVLGISLVTNLAAGIGSTPITHEEVQVTAELSKKRYSQLLFGIVRAIGTL